MAQPGERLLAKPEWREWFDLIRCHKPFSEARQGLIRDCADRLGATCAEVTAAICLSSAF